MEFFIVICYALPLSSMKCQCAHRIMEAVEMNIKGY